MKRNLIIIMLALFVVFGANAQKTINKAKDAKTCSSIISSETDGYYPGTTVDLVFWYTYVSPDYEWNDGVSLQFPAGVSVNSATACTESGGELTYNGETGDGVLASWGKMEGGSGMGKIHKSGSFSVNVTINQTFSGDMNVDWTIVGDGYGAAPHSNSGTIGIACAVNYTISFVVKDGSNPVQGASVFINGVEQFPTDANGEAESTFGPGVYEYMIITSGFENATGTVTLSNQDVEVPITLTPGTAKWPVVFNVTGEEGEPLKGATVKLGIDSVITNDKGVAKFMVADAIDIPCTVSMDKYSDSIFTVTVNGAALERYVQLSLTAYSVIFSITDWKGGVVEGAQITVGEETLATDVNGKATFTEIINSYVFSIFADGLIYTGENTFEVVDQDLNIDLTLNENIITPTVSATDNEAAGATIKWTASLVEVELRHDDGTATGELGAQQGTDKIVLGSVFKHNMDITQVKWFITNQGLETVNLFVFGLKADGTPDGTNILFQQMGITSVKNNWTTFELPKIVSASEGFFVALSGTGFIGLGTDDGKDEPYVAQAGNCFFSPDYTAGTFTDITTQDFPNSFLIRPIGYDKGELSKSYVKNSISKSRAITGTTLTYVALENPIVTNNTEVKNGAKTAQSFDLYFFPETELENQDNWTEVATGLASYVNTYIDTDNWPVTIDGVYYWAVISHFESGNSEAGISNGLVFNNYYSANFTVTKNWGSNDPIDGASIKITGNDDLIVEGTTASGTFSTDLINGDYNYTVSANDCVTKTGTFTIADGEQAVQVALDEIVADPYGLMVEMTSEDAANFTWNNSMGFSDDFESYEDFALTFDPWTLVDVDGSPTYNFNSMEFPNSGSPMAAIIFNPSQIEGGDDLLAAHSGDKYSATFNPKTGDKTCDDWIIAPQITIAAGDEVSFWATGGNKQYSTEKFQVLVSTTDKDPASFVAISEVITCPANSETWIEYTYSLEEYAGKNIYVGIHVTSTDQFFFCLDDFSIGKADKRVVQSYNVFLDDMTTPVASDVTGTSYNFTGLTAGEHKAGVQAVFESGESAVQTLDFTVPISVDGVTLNETLLELNVGDEKTLVATVTPEEATNKNVIWSSSNDAIVSVDIEGKVVAVSAGNATITVTTEDGGFTATSTITALTVPVTSISVSPATTGIIMGNTQQLTATIMPNNATNQNITWSSSSNSIATVDANGLIAGVALGTATITATTEDGGFTATSQIEVVNSAIATTDISISPTTTDIAVGSTQQITTTITPANATNQNVTWSSSDSAIATVNTSGLIAGVAAGIATITATTEDGGFTATSTITVIVPVTSISISPTVKDIAVGSTQQLTATITPANATNQNVTWSSSDSTIATVNTNGLVNAVAAGIATITATTKDGGFTATSTITVIVPVTSISVSPATTGVIMGSTQQLTAAIMPDNATNQNVTWSSSDNAIATVDTKGLVTAVALGTATITATTEDGGFTATSQIEVVNSAVATTGISVSPATADIVVGSAQQLTATITPANATNQNVTWSSSDNAIATVDTKGLVTAVALGTATITVKTEDGGFTAISQIEVVNSAVATTGISVSPATADIVVGSAQQLTATITPANATNQNVTWSSSDNAIATVDANGLVTAIALGTATITVKTEDGGFTATCNIQVTGVGINTKDITDINVYPNPTNGQFYVESFNNGKVEVINIAGQTILIQKLQSGKNKLSISHPGVYFVHVFVKGYNTVKKIVVE